MPRGIRSARSGYVIGYALAGDYLRQGHTVIAESVSPLAVTRDASRDVASSAGARYLEVEVVCSDPAEHKRRASGRTVDIPDLPVPTWQDIERREYELWHRERVALDTARLGIDECVARIRSLLGS